MKTRQGGFGLVELLVVILIFGILTGILLVATQVLRERAVRNKALQFSRNIHNWLVEEAVASWAFDEGTGVTANDASNGHHNLPISTATWTTGILRNALHFDGLSTVALTQPLFASVPPELAVSLWVQPEIGGLNRVIFHNGDDGEFLIGLDATDTVYVNYRTSGGAWQTINTGRIIPPSEWHHIAFSWNSTTDVAYVYVDSKITNELQPGASLYAGTDDVTIGSSQGADFFTGVIDEVEMYNKSF